MTAEERIMAEKYAEVVEKRNRIANYVPIEDRALENAMRVMDIFGNSLSSGKCVQRLKMEEYGEHDEIVAFLVEVRPDEFVAPSYGSHCISQELIFAIQKANGYFDEQEKKRMLAFLEKYCEITTNEKAGERIISLK